MSVARAFTTIVVCGLGFGLAGGLLGLTLGVGAPSYYRGVFRAADDPHFNPVHVGLGLGISQGVICGAIVGSVIVLAMALSRPSRPRGEVVDPSAAHATSSRPQSTVMRRPLILVTLVAAAACAGAIGFAAGAVVGALQLYQQLTDAKLAKIRPVLREPQFAGITAEYSSAAQVYLVGKVESEQAYKALEDKMRFLFGDDESRLMLEHVEVSTK
jgi:hypothetical protein